MKQRERGVKGIRTLKCVNFFFFIQKKKDALTLNNIAQTHHLATDLTTENE